MPKTDGLRNNLYERIFNTNSPNYEETLPTIANPPSIRQVEGKQVLWTVTGPESFVKDHERCEAIRAYGLDKVMQHSHEVTWRDEGDSYTLKLHAAPLKGGDAMLKWYIQAQNGMGWLPFKRATTRRCELTTDQGLHPRVNNPPPLHRHRTVIHREVVRDFAIIVDIHHNKVGLLARFQ